MSSQPVVIADNGKLSVNNKDVPVSMMEIKDDKSTQCNLPYTPEEETVAKKPIMCDTSCPMDSYITKGEPGEGAVDEPGICVKVTLMLSFIH